MRVKALCTVLVLSLILALPTIFYANPVFRDLAWGDAPEAISARFTSNSEYEELGVEVYRREQEELFLGSVALNRVEYHFFEDQLFRIVAYVINEDDHRDAAKAMLEARYGKGKSAFLANKTTWNAGHTTIVWDWPFPGTPDPRIIFTGDDLAGELAAYQKEQKDIQAAKDAASW